MKFMVIYCKPKKITPTWKEWCAAKTKKFNKEKNAVKYLDKMREKGYFAAIRGIGSYS